MGIRIWDGTNESKEIYLRLEYRAGEIPEGGQYPEILLSVCDRDGYDVSHGLLLGIKDGKLRLYKNIDPTLGFELNEKGCLRTYVIESMTA